MKFKIAVVQLDIQYRSPEENLKKIETFIRRAAAAKAQMIVFPEDFISDPIIGGKLIVKSGNLHRKQFQELAKKYGIDMVAGSFTEEDREGLHNTTYYIDSSGRIRSRYRKINLWHPEKSYIVPGHRVPVFNTKFGKIGLIICWDIMFPELFRKMAKQGVRIVICPSYWSYGDAGIIGKRYDKESETKLVDALCIGRAFENEIIFVYCNAAGEINKGKYSDALTGIGHSQITVPFKGAIRKLNNDKEGMFIQEIDTDILDAAEKVYKIRKEIKKIS